MNGPVSTVWHVAWWVVGAIVAIVGVVVFPAQMVVGMVLVVVGLILGPGVYSMPHRRR